MEIRKTSIPGLLFSLTILMAVAVLSGPAVSSTAIIKTLSDLDLGEWEGATELSDDVSHCVATSTGGFSITATGDGAGGSFRVSNGSAEIPFQVYYKDTSKGTQVQLVAGTPANNLSGGTDPTKCKGKSQNVEVRIQDVDMAKVPAGTYSGTLNLMVTPQ